MTWKLSGLIMYWWSFQSTKWQLIIGCVVHDHSFLRFTVAHSTDLPNTVESRFSGFLAYPDFFSGPNLVMNIYYSRSRSVANMLLKTTALKSAVVDAYSYNLLTMLHRINSAFVKRLRSKKNLSSIMPYVEWTLALKLLDGWCVLWEAEVLFNMQFVFVREWQGHMKLIFSSLLRSTMANLVGASYWWLNMRELIL